MRLKLLNLLLLLSALVVNANAQNFEKEISSLIKKMTLEEKVAQLKQPYYAKADRDSLNTVIAKNGLGSILYTVREMLTPEERNEVQRIAVEESRLGIPLFFGYDVIHGFTTVFPSSLGLAASWDEEATRRVAAISADEAAHWGR